MRILAVKTHAAGDLLLTTPALRALKNGVAKADLYLLTGRANAEIAPALPTVDAYLFIDEVALLKRAPPALYNFLRTVKKARPDRVVLFQHDPLLARLASWTGSRVFAPYAPDNPPSYLAGGAPWRPNGEKYVAENYVEVTEAAGARRDRLHLDFVIPEGVPPAAEITGLGSRKKPVALAPGGGRNPRETVAAKLPPEYFFVEIVDFISKETGRQVVLIGGPDDVRRCSAIAAKASGGTVVNLAGKTTVFESARVIEEAAYLVTVDSLPLHIAVALRKPALALFAPTNPRALLPKKTTVTAVAARLECAPCYANSPFPKCKRPLKFECRERIPLAAIKEYILGRAKK